MVDFKKEIEEKFSKSKLTSFVFPKKSVASPKQTKLPNPSMRSTRFEFTGSKNDLHQSLNLNASYLAF